MATLLIALFMISALVYSVSAVPTIKLNEEGGGSVYLVGPGLGYDSDYAINLDLPETPEVSDLAEVVLQEPFSAKTTLSEITSLSFYWTSSTASGLPYPYLILDSDDDSVADTWLIWNIGPDDDTTESTSWEPWTMATTPDDWHMAGPGGPYIDDGTWADMVTAYGGYAVLGYAVELGQGSTNLGNNVFIDDMEINGEIYDFELEPDATVGLTVFVEEFIPTISISVNPTTIGFGTMVQGESSEPQTVTITSTSDVDITLIASVTEVGNFYVDNLGLGDAVVTAWEDTILEGGAPLPVELVLNVPIDAPTGLQSGTLVFWAMETR